MKTPWILLAALHVTFLIQTGKSCTVDVRPKLVFATLNQTITLTCTSSCSLLEWESRLYKKNTTTSGNFSSLEVELDDWDESIIQCLAYSDEEADEIFRSNGTVIAYALPSRVDLHMEKEMEEGKEYEVTCHVYDVAPVKFVTLSLTIGGEILLKQTYKEDKSIGMQNLTKAFIVKADRHQSEFGCQATMDLTDVVTVQSSPVTVSVYYPSDFSTCPETEVWLEGQNVTFLCTAEGNPTPLVQCSFNNSTFQPPKVFIAERSMSGVYECEALNSLRNRTRLVNVTVQYAPETPLLILSENSTIRKGGSFNISCHSDALPPPVYRWKIPPWAKVTYSSDNRTIFLQEASSYFNGIYVCEVTNRHGQSKTEQHVDVEKDNIFWPIFVAVAVGVAVIVAACLVIYYCNKKGHKGFYDLLKRNKGNSHIPVPLEETRTA